MHLHRHNLAIVLLGHLLGPVKGSLVLLLRLLKSLSEPLVLLLPEHLFLLGLLSLLGEHLGMLGALQHDMLLVAILLLWTELLTWLRR